MQLTDVHPNPNQIGLMTEMSRDELIEKLQEVAGEMGEIMRSFGAHEPDWAPLEKALPLKWCGGFMFMGYHKGIRMYKHGFTRYYLFLDEDANAYSYDADTETYERIPLPMAIELVFDGLEEMGYKRSSPYDDAAIEEKNRRLAEAGWNVVTVDPSGGDQAETQ